jgi:pimeloyl-ACP methyl ester carboxylesterase
MHLSARLFLCGILTHVGLLGAEPQVERMSFPLTTTVPGNATVTVQVAWPVDANGQPTPAAQDIALYSPYWCEDKFAEGGIFKTLATAFTTVGIFFDDRAGKGGEWGAIDPESGSFEAIERALGEVRTRRGLASGKVFGCGHSSGGTLIYWAARAHPEAFEAIAPIGGTPPATAQPPAVPTLHVHTLGDAHRVRAALLWHGATPSNSLMLTTDPMWAQRDSSIWLHLNTNESVVLAVDWLRGVADLRRLAGGRLPPMTEWPEQRPAHLVAGTAEEAPTGQRMFPSAVLAERFAQAHRQITRRTDATSGARITTVTPRTGAERTVVVVVAPGRSAEDALYDAVLVAGRHATAIAIMDGTAATVQSLVATLTGPVAVVVNADQAALLAAVPTTMRRLVLAPKATLPPDVTGVEVAIRPGTSPAVRQQELLQAAVAMLAP